MSDTKDIPAKDATPIKAEVFTFGEPVPVMDRAGLLDHLEVIYNGRYYEPPISLRSLIKTFRANSHHESAIRLKQQILTSTYVPNPLLSKRDLASLALDFLITGNAYVERINNRLGTPVALKYSPAIHTRRNKADDEYVWVKEWHKEHHFAPGSVFHLIEPDPAQEIYGMPYYMGGLNSVWLNESATLFRRKYYENGSHAGFILYVTDPAVDDTDIEAMKKALKQSKGVGNFKNLFVRGAGGQNDGIKLIPIAEVAAKDEFLNIKGVSRDDILAAHRVPPPLMGIVPNNTGGFGSVEAAAKVFVKNELEPLQARFTELNDWLGDEVITFAPYDLDVQDAGERQRRR